MNKFSKGDHLVSFVTIGHLIAVINDHEDANGFGEDDDVN